MLNSYITIQFSAKTEEEAGIVTRLLCDKLEPICGYAPDVDLCDYPTARDPDADYQVRIMVPCRNVNVLLQVAQALQPMDLCK